MDGWVPHDPTERAAEVLGFRPRHNVGQWLEELRSLPEVGTDEVPPWP